MVNRDGKKLHVLRHHASAVSRALWPAHMHRSGVTGKAALRRRHISTWWTFLAHTSEVYMPLILVVTSMLVGGSIVAALVLHAWYVLLLPLVILALATFLLVQPLFLKLDPTLWQTSREPRSLQGFPTMRRTPETPMPPAPRVRVLETVDLSETGVEHFLDKV